MWFKLPPITLQRQRRWSNHVTRDNIQIQSKETASSTTAVNMKQKAQRAHIHHFIVQESLSKDRRNMPYQNGSHISWKLLKNAYSLAYDNPESKKHSSSLQFSIIEKQEHCLPPTWEKGKHPPLSCLNMLFFIEPRENAHLGTFLFHIYLTCMKLYLWHGKAGKCCLNTWFFAALAWRKAGSLITHLLVWGFLLFSCKHFFKSPGKAAVALCCKEFHVHAKTLFLVQKGSRKHGISALRWDNNITESTMKNTDRFAPR